VFRASERYVYVLWEVLARVHPAEVVAPESWAEVNEKVFAERLPGVLLTRFDDWYFGQSYAYDALKEHFRVASLKGFGCDDLTVGIAAAGGVLFARKPEGFYFAYYTAFTRANRCGNGVGFGDAAQFGIDYDPSRRPS
jgi:hypothetical protein